MRKLITLVLILLSVFPKLGLAQIKASPNPAPSASHARKGRKKSVISNQKFAPIDVDARSYEYYDADSGWTDATSVSYSYKGSTLEQPKDFERVIYPINDPEANDLLRSAADKDGWGQGFLWGGIAVETAGWTDFAIEMANMGDTTHSGGHTTFHDPNMAPSVLMVLGGDGAYFERGLHSI
jgi:hypothetical protein